ncbi:hypothetical protein DET65_2701 [Sunxiuqinia elliptica]|uniref:Uncharacterized protein n=1 Tax=Sunxiuqinia elliptica TaxID=655355 RepID=A0A4R6H5P8_9BACT|nr:hypothetical protein DET52_103158 [Sunxiuqinia elliptica]TDO59414.1 hypothetical protein DET65_2701 [Sunxiuqinia elliptica]
MNPFRVHCHTLIIFRRSYLRLNVLNPSGYIATIKIPSKRVNPEQDSTSIAVGATHGVKFHQTIRTPARASTNCSFEVLMRPRDFIACYPSLNHTIQSCGSERLLLEKGGEKATVGMYRFGISLAAYLASNLKITSKPLSREELLSWKNRNRNSSYSSLTSYLAMSFSSVSPKRCS